MRRTWSGSGVRTTGLGTLGVEASSATLATTQPQRRPWERGPLTMTWHLRIDAGAKPFAFSRLYQRSRSSGRSRLSFS